MQRREGDEIVFIVLFEMVESVTDLADMDGAGEGGFLGVIAL